MSRQVPTRRGGGKLAAQRRLEEIAAAGDAMTAVELELAKKRLALNKMISDTYNDDIATPSQIANALGISRQRVYQIVEEVTRKGA